CALRSSASSVVARHRSADRPPPRCFTDDRRPASCVRSGFRVGFRKRGGTGLVEQLSPPWLDDNPCALPPLRRKNSSRLSPMLWRVGGARWQTLSLSRRRYG